MDTSPDRTVAPPVCFTGWTVDRPLCASAQLSTVRVMRLHTSLLVCACVRPCLLVCACVLLRPCLLVGARLRLDYCLLACTRVLRSTVSLVCVPPAAHGLNTCHLVCSCKRRACLPGACGRVAMLPSCTAACVGRARMPTVWVTSSSGRAGLEPMRLTGWTDGTWPALVGTCHPPGERCPCRWTSLEIPPVARCSEPLILASGPEPSLHKPEVRLPASEAGRALPINQEYSNYLLLYFSSQEKQDKHYIKKEEEEGEESERHFKRTQREYTATTGTHSLHLSHFCHTHMMTRIADPSVVHQLPPLTG